MYLQYTNTVVLCIQIKQRGYLIMPMKKIHLTIDEEDYKKMKKIAIHDSAIEKVLTANDIIREACKDYLDKRIKK